MPNFYCRCKWGNCVNMPKPTENRCCMENPRMRDLMDPVEAGCIIQHPGFQPACLNTYVLDIAYLQYQQQYRAQINSLEE